MVDEETQTDPIPVREMEIQTDLSSVNVDLIAAPAVQLEVESALEELAPPRTPLELQRELAQELGVDLATLEKFVEAQKAPAPSMSQATTSPSVVQISASARRAGRWASRMGTRAALQGPALFVSVRRRRTRDRGFGADTLSSQVFPESAKPYVGQILESSLTFFLYTATVWLTGFIVR